MTYVNADKAKPDLAWGRVYSAAKVFRSVRLLDDALPTDPWTLTDPGFRFWRYAEEENFCAVIFIGDQKAISAFYFTEYVAR
ncbi:hypothetical protein E4U12_008370 [Claviceps purpurea]|nr:hypothetical protein E4U12_008370 [Claviceps purpurea]